VLLLVCVCCVVSGVCVCCVVLCCVVLCGVFNCVVLCCVVWFDRCGEWIVSSWSVAPPPRWMDGSSLLQMVSSIVHGGELLSLWVGGASDRERERERNADSIRFDSIRFDSMGVDRPSEVTNE